VVLLAFPFGEWLAARWRHLARRRSLLATGCAGLAVERGERILSACRARDGGYALVATDRALYRRAGPGCWSRLGWERVTRVAWDGEAGEPGEPGRFVITVLSGTGPARLVVPAAERGGMPELAAERMTHAGRDPGDGRERGREVELAIARLAAEFSVIYRPRSGGTAGEAE
jgi:hypothetical protein